MNDPHANDPARLSRRDRAQLRLQAIGLTAIATAATAGALWMLIDMLFR